MTAPLFDCGTTGCFHDSRESAERCETRQWPARRATCPECGAPLDFDPACRVVEVIPVMAGFQRIDRPLKRRYVVRTVPVVLCTGCEFVREEV